jgi:D-alanine-D-alanine ligase
MKNVAIICGGFSSEYEISIKSASNILANFPEGFNVYLIKLSKNGWFAELNGVSFDVDLKDLSFMVDATKIKTDIAIVYIHGDPGENGKVQAYLDMIDVPYVNSGPLASELSFDKWYCNQFLSKFNVPVAESIYLTNPRQLQSSENIVSQLGLPLFVKPCDSGSSFGIAKVSKEENLKEAVDAAFKEGRTVVIESFLDGTEVTCGVYRGKHGVEALPVTEIVTENDFFDYKAKYEGLSQEITPARIDDKSTRSVQELAIKIYQLLQLKSIARIDFMLVDGIPHVIEVNTTPGFSNESIVPKMIACKGMSTADFWRDILEGEGYL